MWWRIYYYKKKYGWKLLFLDVKRGVTTKVRSILHFTMCQAFNITLWFAYKTNWKTFRITSFMTTLFLFVVRLRWMFENAGNLYILRKFVKNSDFDGSFLSLERVVAKSCPMIHLRNFCFSTSYTWFLSCSSGGSSLTGKCQPCLKNFIFIL